MLHVYDKVFHGFSTRLTMEETLAMESMQSMVGIFLEKARQLLTTRTYQFLDLDSSKSLWPKFDFGFDVIIGVLNMGIWLESKSFWGGKVGLIS